MASMLLEQYSLAGIAVRSFVLLVLTAGIALVFRRRSAAFLHGIWTVGLAGCLVIPIVTSLSPSWTLPLLPPQVSEAASKPAARSAEQPAISVPASLSRTPSLANETSKSASSTPVISTELSQPGPVAVRVSSAVVAQPVIEPVKWPSLETVVLSIWAAGFFAVLLRLVQQLVAVRIKVSQASDLDDADWHSRRDVASQLLGMRADVSLKRHSGALSPMVVGLFRPVVLLPDDADAWSHEQRKLVLLHELAHVKRRDVLTQLMATLSCAVYWFNPLAWWGAGQMKRLREIACDDAVVTHSGTASTYAQTLLDVARRYRCQPTSAVAMARSSHVEGRIAAILSSTRSRAAMTPRSLRAFTAVALLAAAIVGTCHVISRAEDPTERKTDQQAAPKSTAQETSPSRTMLVRVLDVAGQPLSDVNILVNIGEMPGVDDYPNTQDYKTDKQGHARIALPGRLNLLRMWPTKDGYVPMFVNFNERDPEKACLIPDEFEFRLPKGHRLSGRVVDEQGAPITKAKVQVKIEGVNHVTGANPDTIINTWLAEDNDAAVTDAKGRWSINNAPAPPEQGHKDFEFQLQVTHPKFAGDSSWGELQRKQGITTANLRTGDATLTLDPGIAVTGQVTGPDGKPVHKGLVIWNDRPYWATGVNECQIDESGHYKTKHLAPGKYPITVLAPGFAPWRNTIDVYREISDLDIQLEPGNPIRIRFVDQAGAPIPKVSVSIGDWRRTEAIYNHKHPNVPESGIPRHANEEGMYEWTWAPADAVTYQVYAKGFAPQELALVAKPEPHVITLAAPRVVVGTITDTATGKPIERFQAMPVIVFRPDFYHTRRSDAKDGQDGRYELPLTGSGDPNDRYRVRFEAEGYRSVVSDESFGPLDGRATLNMALQPAPARTGRVVDADGRPVENATILEASPTNVPDTSNGKPDSWDSRPVPTGAQGNFQLHATAEPVRIRAYHDLGFAEKTLTPDETAVGELTLAPWAGISGRLMQAGRPIADQSIHFFPLIRHGLTEARFQDSYYARTDADGRFQIDRIPPIAGSLKAHLGPWQESPLTSSESIPLELRSGEHREVVLGGDGATITGRVVATGRSNAELSKQWSLNYLVSRDRGVDNPNEAAPLSFDPSGSLQSDWLRQPDFDTWVATRRNYFVKLSDDGRLNVHGVAPGAYDLVIQLYEQPAGCLIETIGEKVVPVVVTARQAEAGTSDIGDVEVQCRIGPRTGSDMRAFKFTDHSGQVRYVDDLQGQFVLLHAWATWCAPCIESMPTLKAAVGRYSDSPLSVVGLNVDEDAAAARVMANAQEMNWAQNYLGPDSDLMRQLAVSSVPAYYLIGPDGKLIGSANQWEAIEQLLKNNLDPHSTTTDQKD